MTSRVTVPGFGLSVGRPCGECVELTAVEVILEQ